MAAAERFHELCKGFDFRSCRRQCSSSRGASCLGRPVTVFEYPAWIGTIASSTLNSLAYLGDVVGVMQEALAAHASQMRLENQDEWRTLSGLSGGDFVGRLLADYEMFTRSEINI